MRNPIRTASDKTTKFLSGTKILGMSLVFILVVLFVLMLFGARMTWLNSKLSRYTWWQRLTGGSSTAASTTGAMPTSTNS